MEVLVFSSFGVFRDAQTVNLPLPRVVWLRFSLVYVCAAGGAVCHGDSLMSARSPCGGMFAPESETERWSHREGGEAA